MSPNIPLTPAQEQVLALIAAGVTVTGAAREAGIHRNTVGNWLRSSPAFRLGLHQAHYNQSLHWREQSELLAGNAFAALHEIIDNPRASSSARIKAALAIIKLADAPLNPYPDSTGQIETPLDPGDYEPPPPPESEKVHNSAQSPAVPYVRPAPKTGRNDACPCGSGRKFKQCCLGKSSADPPSAAELTA